MKRRGCGPSSRSPKSSARFAGQLTEDVITGIVIEYAGDVGDMNTRALTSAALAGVLQPQLGTVNMVSAPVVAKERGIKVDEVRQTQRGAYETYIRLTVKTKGMERSVAGSVFSDGKPRIIQIKGIELESEFGPHMLYVTNMDKPGFIGALGIIARRCQGEYCDLPSGPPGARGGCHLPGSDRRAGAGRTCSPPSRNCRMCGRRSDWRSRSAPQSRRKGSVCFGPPEGAYRR